MKKIKIAFTGVFDIDNFGDHLFPIIFENSLRKRKIDVELFLFSPYESTQGFGIAKKVYSIREMEKLHKINKFDAIVVGGGVRQRYASYRRFCQCAGDRSQFGYAERRRSLVYYFLCRD